MQNIILSKAVVLTICFMLCFSLVSCKSSSEPQISSSTLNPAESKPEPADTQQETEFPTIDELLLISAAEKIEDSAFLEKFWNDYICFTFLTISNGITEFDSVEDIPIASIADYLNIQMQRDNDTDVIKALDGGKSDTFSIPVDKLTAYCEQYFGKPVDFTQSDIRAYYSYNADTKSASFSPQRLSSFDGIYYNNIEDWPNFTLDYVMKYQDDLYLAATSFRLVHAIDEENETLTKYFLLKKRADGSYFFVSSKYVFPETHYVSFEGNFSELPFIKNKPSYIAIGSTSNTYIGAGELKSGIVPISLVDFTSGKILKSINLELPETYYGYAYLKAHVNNLVAITGDSMIVWDKDLNVAKPLTPLPKTLIDGADYDKSASDFGGSISNVDFNDDLTKIVFSDGEGIKIYDFNTDKITVVPESEAYYDKNNIMRSSGYKTVEIVDNNKKVFAWKVGYESTIGYMLYDIEKNESRFYPYSGGYGIWISINNSGVMLAHHYEYNKELEPLYIDFATGDVVPKPDFKPSESGNWLTVNDKYSAWVEETLSGNRMANCRIIIQDNSTGISRAADCLIKAPAGSVGYSVFCTDDGKAYVEIDYLGEQYTLLVG